MPRRTIKYPYTKLTDLERRRIKEWREKFNWTDNDIIVTELTDRNVGYDIIVSKCKPYKIGGEYHFGVFYMDVTDREFEAENI